MQAIERLSISAANAIAWLRTADGRLIFKVCVSRARKGHEWLAARTRDG